jgi:surface polysaccharide O-acyltransferase-like enzyme
MKNGSIARSRKTVLCFEWARGFAAAMVVLLHVTQGIMTNYPINVIGESRAVVWTVSQFLLTRWAVPIFLMISGALLLNPGKTTGWKDVRRYERRMALVLATFGYLYCLLEQYSGTRQLAPPLFGISALNLLSGKSWSHLWYLYAMMGIYLLLPMMKAYVATARRKDLQIFLIVLFAFTSCIPSFNNAMSTNVVTLIWIPCYVFYFFLGYYAFNFLELTRRLTLPCAVLVTLGCLVQTTYVLAGNYGEWVRSPASVFVFGLSLMVFLLFKKYFERPFEPDGVVALASSYSFGIYVIHPVFVNVAYKVIGLGPWSMPPVAFELSMWLFALLGSVLVVWIMRRIPGLRRIL